jgi:hypothetical protein
MQFPFGEFNAALTGAINRVARKGSAGIRFLDHAQEEMDADDIDHLEVMECLKNGKAYGPEIRNKRVRANVIHRGLEIRVVVGGLDSVNEAWTKLNSLTVVTTMRMKKK